MTAHARSSAFDPLSEAELQKASVNGTDQAESIVALVIPERALSAIPRHPHLGSPSRHWVYRDGEGQALLVVCRFDPPGDDKQIRPLIWGRDADGREGWNWFSRPAPRPLFGLDRLAARPAAPVLIVEGEKAAEAAEALFPDHVVATSPGGAKAADQTDWSPLADRQVTIWPDHDHPGQSYARDVARLAHAAGALTVRLVQVPHAWPERWDLADALPEGVSSDDLHDLLARAEIAPPPPLYRPVSGYR